KTIYKIALLSALALTAFTSCDALLEEESFGRPTTEDMLTNENNITCLVGQAYADLRFMHDHWGYWGVNTLTSDEGLCPIRRGGDWNDGGYWKYLNTHEWNAYGEAFKNIWNCTVSGSVLCNSLLNTLYSNEENISEDIYNKFVGELEVLRSYYYYLLFDSFGRIPYKEDFSDRVEALLDPPVVWAHLVSTLERNAPNMVKVDDSNRSLYLGRCTQGFAYTLLARLYLNAESFGCTPENVMAAARTYDVHNGPKGSHPLEEVGINITSVEDFYTNAIRCANKVIESNSYVIEPDYFNNYLIDNGGSRENIFTIVEDGLTAEYPERDEYSCKNKLRIEFLSLHYKFQDRFNTQLDCWNGFCARPEYMTRFNDYDVRGAGFEGTGTMDKEQWGWFLGPLCDVNGNVMTETVDRYGDDNKPVYEKDENGNFILNKDGTKKIEKETLDITMHIEINSLDCANRMDGARMYKYELDKEHKYMYMENDFVLFRYADVILMKKEAILRGGRDDNPGNEDSAIKDIKRRTFIHSMKYQGKDPIVAFDEAYPDAFTVLSTDLNGGILAERGREFSWENVRRRDLIRFGQFENIQYVTNNDKTRRWFPIPFSVLQKSVVDENGNKVWTQNEGY
ncbi:MAG: RagB/SusD family nutrient uptake outer membrane protein, partial [Candidatus Cryptobacteroides sp.]